MIVLRKTITVERGQKLLYPETRYFFYFTNRRDLTAVEIVAHANDRCDQENLNAHLKGGVRALRAPVDTLVSNWAYMVMTALAWSLKAWFALLLPTSGRWRNRYHEEQRSLLRMEFRTFLNAIIRIPAQIVQTGRRIVFRLMAYNRWLPALFRGVEGLRALRCCRLNSSRNRGTDAAVHQDLLPEVRSHQHEQLRRRAAAQRHKGPVCQSLDRVDVAVMSLRPFPPFACLRTSGGSPPTGW